MHVAVNGVQLFLVQCCQYLDNTSLPATGLSHQQHWFLEVDGLTNQHCQPEKLKGAVNGHT